MKGANSVLLSFLNSISTSFFSTAFIGLTSQIIAVILLGINGAKSWKFNFGHLVVASVNGENESTKRLSMFTKSLNSSQMLCVS